MLIITTIYPLIFTTQTKATDNSLNSDLLLCNNITRLNELCLNDDECGRIKDTDVTTEEGVRTKMQKRSNSDTLLVEKKTRKRHSKSEDERKNLRKKRRRNEIEEKNIFFNKHFFCKIKTKPDHIYTCALKKVSALFFEIFSNNAIIREKALQLMKKKENFSKRFSQEKYFYFVMRFILKKGFLKTNDPSTLFLKTLAFHTYTYIQFISLSRIFDDDMSYPAAIYNFVNCALDIKFNKKCNWKIDQLLVFKNYDIRKLLTYSLVKDRITKKDFEMCYR